MNIFKRTGLTLVVVGFLILPAGQAFAAGNNYPYPGHYATVTIDPWGMSKGQCTSFVAFRESRIGHPIIGDGIKDGNAWNADHWDNQLLARGWRSHDRNPRVGDVAQWDSNETTYYLGYDGKRYSWNVGPMGHVAYVAAVYRDGSILLEDYNGFGGSEKYGSWRGSPDIVGDFLSP